MSKVDLSKPFEVKINGEWYESAGITYLHYKPDVWFFHKKGNFPFGDYSYQDYPLDSVEDFRNLKPAPKESV